MGKTRDRREDRYLVPGLARGLAILQAFSEEAPRHSPASLARRLGVTRSGLFRTLYTLTELGFLLHDPRSGSYAIGPAVVTLGGSALPRRALLTAAWPRLGALRDATGCSAHLGLLDGAEVVYMLRAAAQEARAGIVHLGTRLPAHATSLGRVLLAGLAEEEVAALYADLPLRRTAPGMPASLAGLLRRARQDRARGHVVHLGDFEAGVASLAVPLRDARRGVVAAISLSATLPMMAEPLRPALLRSLTATAEAIAAATGAGRG